MSDPVDRSSTHALRGRPATVEVAGPTTPHSDEVLDRDALAFVADLHQRFNPTRQRLLAARLDRQARFDA